jgi:hypothetical protein
MLALLLASCSSAYYGAMERFGIEKRDILVDRVEDTREAQEEAREQFESALEQFIAATNFQGGELEQVYDRLKGEYEASAAEAERVRERIASVEKVSEDLFAEWEEELGRYKDANLRRTSARQLEDTRNRYRQLMRALQRAEKSMEPVLAAFQDRVLYLKHNLNARAIAALRADRQAIESDIQTLIKQKNASNEEADRFIREMEASS